jgi:hypothetical protein
MSVPSDAAQIRSVTTQHHRPEARGSLALGALLILPALSLAATGAVTAQPMRPELRDDDKGTDALIEWRCEVYRCAEVGNRASATVRAVRRQHQPETESIDSGLGRCDGRPRNLSESSFCAIGLPVSRERRNERARGYRHSHLR